MKFYVFSRVPLPVIRSLFTVHSAMVYVIQVWRQLSSRNRSCSRAVFKPVWHTCIEMAVRCDLTRTVLTSDSAPVFTQQLQQWLGHIVMSITYCKVNVQFTRGPEKEKRYNCTFFAGCCSILHTGHITLSSTPDQQLENHSTKYHRQQPPYNTLELLMMGILVPETCWASNKSCNKNLCCI